MCGCLRCTERTMEVPKSLEQKAAEAVTQQTIRQLPGSALIELLGRTKLEELLKDVGTINPSLLVKALPKPNGADRWKKNCYAWTFDDPEQSSSIMVCWTLDDQRRLTLHIGYLTKTTAVCSQDVENYILPQLERLGLDADAVGMIRLASADYFNRPLDERLMHSRSFGECSTTESIDESSKRLRNH